MWWRMYSGHNCTNYVAYRLVKGGMSPERPWDSTGMAYNWGRANRSITDDTPMVGAVAWWEAGDSVGSSGHVAYVQQVVSNRKIVISEDSWSGDFHWRVIRKRGGGWPTGFIHFDDREVRPSRSRRSPATPRSAARWRSTSAGGSPSRRSAAVAQRQEGDPRCDRAELHADPRAAADPAHRAGLGDCARLPPGQGLHRADHAGGARHHDVDVDAHPVGYRPRRRGAWCLRAAPARRRRTPTRSGGTPTASCSRAPRATG